jgi:hypothetical protein
MDVVAVDWSDIGKEVVPLLLAFKDGIVPL